MIKSSIHLISDHDKACIRRDQTCCSDFMDVKRKSRKSFLRAKATLEKVLKAITEMPDTFSVDDLLDRLILLQKVENGNSQSDAGKTVSNDQAREVLSKWLK